MLLCGRGRAIAAVILTILVLCDHAVKRGAAVKCGSLRLQNELEDLSKLENCTIITGYLSLLLMEKATDEHDWDKYSFPNLIEIWEYLFVYRARRLTTLGNLFPNLRLIKGQETIHNHALVIWSMDSLQEVLNIFWSLPTNCLQINMTPRFFYVALCARSIRLDFFFGSWTPTKNRPPRGS